MTKEFCEWVAGLGGESNNIEESTITSLFASGYETKPALSVPIHVVELTNVPPELRMSAAVPSQPGVTKKDKEEQKKVCLVQIWECCNKSLGICNKKKHNIGQPSLLQEKDDIVIYHARY